MAGNQAGATSPLFLYQSLFLIQRAKTGYNFLIFPSKNITKTRLFKYIENFTNKNCKFSDKNSDIFHISAQNIEYGYSLEPPRRGGYNEYPLSMFLSKNKNNNV